MKILSVWCWICKICGMGSGAVYAPFPIAGRGFAYAVRERGELALALKIGSWLCAVFVIFSALVWLIGSFLVINAPEGVSADMVGLGLIPSFFWPMRAVVSALGMVGAIILVLSRPSFLRVLAVWFICELGLMGWLYATGFLATQFDSLASVRGLVILQMCNFCVVLFARVKHGAFYGTGGASPAC